MWRETVTILSSLVFLVDLTVESPVTTSSTQPTILKLDSSVQASKEGGSEISYFWHQKGLPQWPWEPSTVTRNPNSRGKKIILIHTINDEPTGSNRNGNKISHQMNIGFVRDHNLQNNRGNGDDNGNVFVFCLMVLFGCIICSLLWCLCNVSRSQFDSNRESMSSTRISRTRSGRRATIEVIIPDTSDLPPSYDDIVADFEKLGAQCILPSYRDIMSGGSSSSGNYFSSSPPPRYSSPQGSFSGQGKLSDPVEG